MTETVDHTATTATKAESTITVPACQLVGALSVITPCASAAEREPRKNVIRFIPRGDEVAIAATNGHALGRFVITDGVEAADGAPFSVPLAAVTDWLKSLRKFTRSFKDTPVTVSSNGSSATLNMYDTTLSTRLGDSEWIGNWERLFPSGDCVPTTSVVLSSSVLSALVKAFPPKQNPSGFRFEMPRKTHGPVVVTSYDREEFRAILMPMNKR